MRYILSLLLVCVGVGTAVVLYLTKPQTRRVRPAKPQPLVEAVSISRTSQPVTIEAYGTVVPAREMTLQAQVGGQITDLDPELVPGGLLPTGCRLLQIDPTDYRLEIVHRLAALEEARFALEVEEGKGVVARREWDLLKQDVTTSDAGRRLALRQPHLKHAEAQVEAAESRLALARLDEERTTLTTPFNALVLSESVEVGQLVAPGDPLARLVGTDRFWVQTSVPVGGLQRIVLSQGDRQGAEATITLQTANGSETVRQGHVLRLQGDLSPEGRMARVRVALDNPLDISAPAEASTPSESRRNIGPRAVLLGSHVKVEIDAGTEKDVFVVPRTAVREGDRLWLVDTNGTLVFRQIEILWRRKDDVLVDCDAQPGERLVLSRLSTPLPGMSVRIYDAETGGEGPETTSLSNHREPE